MLMLGHFHLTTGQGLTPVLLQQSLHGDVSVPVQLNPLVSVSYTSVLYEGSKHHEEADEEVNINRLHVGDFGQSSVDRVAERGHGQYRGHSQTHPGWSCSSVQPE